MSVVPWAPYLQGPNSTRANSSAPFNVLSGFVGPYVGSMFAYLLAGEVNTYTYLNYTIEAQAGGTVSFDIKFDAGDAPPYNDESYAADVQILPPTSGGGSNSITLFRDCVACVGAYSSSPWEHIEYTFGVTGTHVLTFGVRNIGDGNYPSALALDNVAVCVTDTPGTCAGRSPALYCGRSAAEVALRNELATEGIAMSPCAGSYFLCTENAYGLVGASQLLPLAMGTACMPGMDGGAGSIVMSTACSAGVYTGGAGAVSATPSGLPTPRATPSSGVSPTGSPSRASASRSPSAPSTPSAAPTVYPDYYACVPVTCDLGCTAADALPPGVCSYAFIHVYGGMWTPPMHVPAGTACLNGALVFISECGALLQTPTPSQTPRATHGVVPSPTGHLACEGATTTSGFICATTDTERWARGNLTAQGIAVSPCTGAYQQCFAGVVYPVLPVASGTACLNNEIVLQSSPACAAGVWPLPLVSLSPSPASRSATMSVSPSAASLSSSPSPRSPTQSRTMAPSVPTASTTPSSYWTVCPTDGLVCDGPCALSFHYCSGGTPSSSMAVALGTVCVTSADGHAALAWAADVGCSPSPSAAPRTPLPSLSFGTSPSTSPSASPFCGPSGITCAADPTEAALRANLTVLGIAVSRCMGSFVQCWQGSTYPMQATAPGTGCLDGSIVSRSNEVCAAGVWVGPPPPTPSASLTPGLPPPTPAPSSSPYVPTPGCPWADGIVCDAECGTTFHTCVAGVAYGSQATAMGTVCSTDNTGAYLYFPSDLGCATALSASALPQSASPSYGTSPTPAPSTVCGNTGIICAESAYEQALRTNLSALGIAASPCTASFVQCWQGGSGGASPVQSTAPGTACYANTIVPLTNIACESGVWVGPPLPSPSATLTPGLPPPTPVPSSSPYIPTARCPWADGIVCDADCGTTFHVCVGGVAYGSQPTTPGTVCSTNGTGAYLAFPADLGCPSGPSASPVPVLASGYVCGASPAEQATRDALAVAGYAPSPCYLSFYRVFGGLTGPLQPVALGTVCVNGAIALLSDALCGVMAFTPSASASPSFGYTASGTASPSWTPIPTTTPRPPSATPTPASASASPAGGSGGTGGTYCVTNGPNLYAPPCYSYYEQINEFGVAFAPQPLAAGIACYVQNPAVPGANASLVLVNVFTDPRCSGTVPSQSAPSSPASTPSAPPSPVTPSFIPSPSAPVAAPPSAACPSDGLFCTSQCGGQLYACARGIQYPPWPNVAGTRCYDSSVAAGGPGGEAALILSSDSRCIAPNCVCTSSNASAVCYWPAISARAPHGMCTNSYYSCVGGAPLPLATTPTGTLCLNGALVFAGDASCVGSVGGASSTTPSPMPSPGAIITITISVSGLASGDGNLDPATAASICSLFATLLSNGTIVITPRDVTVTGAVPAGATPSATPAAGRGLRAIADAGHAAAASVHAAVARNLALLTTAPLVAYTPPAPPLPGVPVLTEPPPLGFGGMLVTLAVRTGNAKDASTVASGLAALTAPNPKTGINPVTHGAYAAGLSLVVRPAIAPAIVVGAPTPTASSKPAAVPQGLPSTAVAAIAGVSAALVVCAVILTIFVVRRRRRIVSQKVAPEVALTTVASVEKAVASASSDGSAPSVHDDFLADVAAAPASATLASASSHDDFLADVAAAPDAAPVTQVASDADFFSDVTASPKQPSVLSPNTPATTTRDELKAATADKTLLVAAEVTPSRVMWEPSSVGAIPHVASHESLARKITFNTEVPSTIQPSTLHVARAGRATASNGASQRSASGTDVGAIQRSASRADVSSIVLDTSSTSNRVPERQVSSDPAVPAAGEAAPALDGEMLLL